MENASKALLIAGAVLIVIVLISVGMVIVRSASGITGQVDDLTTTQAITAFNSQFENYVGTQRGATIRSLLNEIATNNASNASGHIVTVKLKLTTDGETEEITTSVDITKKSAEVVNSARYSVVATNKDSDGYISEITIERK